MGSPDSEKGRADPSYEGPQHRVTIAMPFAVGKFEVTRGQFDRFAKATGHDVGNSCWTYEGEWKVREGKSYRDPGFSQDDNHPVVCVNWTDARAYVAWLSKQTRKSYRLLSEAEWEFAARGETSPGKYPRFQFGDQEKDLCSYSNGADKMTSVDWRNQSCSDGVGEATASVGSYKPNAFGLHDAHGNVWEWTEDCWNDSYKDAPEDGSAWTSGNCDRRVLRGGSWDDDPGSLRSADRDGSSTDDRDGNGGFRVARTLTP